MDPSLIPRDDDEPRDPLSVRDDPELRAAYTTPVEGLPDWLEPSIWSWVEPQLHVASGRGNRAIKVEVLQEFERVARTEISEAVVRSKWSESLDRIRWHLRQKPETYLDFIDFLVGQNLRDVAEPERYLREGGSVWAVDTAEEPYKLVRRVTEELKVSRDRVLAEAAESPRHLLALAWRATYGRSPHPSDGYRSAVRACEAALIAEALPEDPKPSLGKVIAHLNDARPRWSVELPGDPEVVDAQETFLGLLRHLWTGQYDRHVSEGLPLHVSQDEAEQAVLLAITVLQLATTRAFQHA